MHFLNFEVEIYFKFHLLKQIIFIKKSKHQNQKNQKKIKIKNQNKG